MEKSVRAEVKQSAEKYRHSCDALKSDIADLFKGRVGRPFEDDQLMQWHSIAEVRRANRIPPGYEDSGKETNQNGDVFLWLELIAETKRCKRPLIFVTMDTKLDWFIKDVSKKIVCPRPELVDEMRRVGGFDCLIYSADEFLEASNKNLKAVAKQESITEVKNSVAERSYFISDEQAYRSDYETMEFWENEVKELSAELERMKEAVEMYQKRKQPEKVQVFQDKIAQYEQRLERAKGRYQSSKKSVGRALLAARIEQSRLSPRKSFIDVGEF